MSNQVWLVVQQIAIIALAVSGVLQSVKKVLRLKSKAKSKLLRFFPVISLFLGALTGFLYMKFSINGVIYGIAGGGISSWFYSFVKKTILGR